MYECSRLGCDQIMCKDLHVFGDYICSACQKEFKQRMKKLGYAKADREFYAEQLREFLNT